MATITSIKAPDILSPVYNDIQIILSASETPNYYITTITISGQTREYKTLPDTNGNLNINLNKILQQFFTTSIHINSSMKEIIPNSILVYNYDIQAVYDDDAVATFNSSDYYCFNACTNDEIFDLSKYLLQSNNYALPLNTRKGSYVTKLDQYLSVQFINGVFHTEESWFIDLGIKAYYKDGSTRNAVIATADIRDTGICSLDISPSTLSGLTSQILFNDDLVKYWIYSTKFQLQEVYIDKPDQRFDKNWRFVYVNQLGGLDFINFNIGYEVNLNISKDYYENQNIKKQYNNVVEKKIKLVTDYMPSETSMSLEDLWISPLIKEISGIYPYEVIIDAEDVTIKHKRSEKLISYEVPFRSASKYKIIKQ